MMTDPISDLLTRIRNALTMKRSEVVLPSSKMAKRIVDILKKEGFILDYAVQETDGRQHLALQLKYDASGSPLIEGLKRISKPGLRIYKAVSELPRVRGGLGIAIVSTSRGVLTCRHARKTGVGGEVICHVW